MRAGTKRIPLTIITGRSDFDFVKECTAMYKVSANLYLNVSRKCLHFAGFYLGFIVWRRSTEWPKATTFLGGSGGMLWCILRPNFEKCALTLSRLDDFSDIVTYIL